MGQDWDRDRDPQRARQWCRGGKRCRGSHQVVRRDIVQVDLALSREGRSIENDGFISITDAHLC